jgi:hypothetical protein
MSVALTVRRYFEVSSSEIFIAMFNIARVRRLWLPEREMSKRSNPYAKPQTAAGQTLIAYPKRCLALRRRVGFIGLLPLWRVEVSLSDGA